MSFKCCPFEVIPFGNEAVTTIDYTPSRKTAYGPEPAIDVLYYDSTLGTFYTMNGQPPGAVHYDGDHILTVDHGGPSTGFIRLGV